MLPCWTVLFNEHFVGDAVGYHEVNTSHHVNSVGTCANQCAGGAEHVHALGSAHLDGVAVHAHLCVRVDYIANISA